ncbi:MAG: hypothetical protein FWC20_07640 [Oscillospiraceae bacterium]|nr:hypothetical protein [Oscillospiraceae bacterium]MCL2279261.1 hypothetical protein [Oscillospiraceae bacterium]
MPYVAFRDNMKEQKIESKNTTIADVKRVFYCKTSDCQARMTLVNGADSARAFFRRMPSSPRHISNLCSADGYFDTTEYEEEKFDFSAIFSSIIKTSNSPNGKISTNRAVNGGGGKKAISTLLQIYLMCRKHSCYNNHCTDDILVDERNFERYKDGIVGQKIVQCTTYHKIKGEHSHKMNYPSFPYEDGKHIKLNFSSDELFWHFYNKFKDTNHKELIIVLGDWRESNEEDNGIMAECTIYKKRQIHFIKSDST